MKWILTFNAGSSSIKYSAFHIKDQTMVLEFKGLIEGIGEKQSFWTHETTKSEHLFKNHQQAFQALLKPVTEGIQGEIIGIAHRVVHGGSQFSTPTVVDKTVLSTIQSLSNLAPLHNPANALGIEVAKSLFPKCPHVAIFDTAFHVTMPESAHTYAIDKDICHQYQIKRYGFHGINHQYVAEQAAGFLLKPLSHCQLITLHLGNGASACLIKDGKSYDTSMGFTPLPGLIMGTRCGDIDPSIILYLADQGITMASISSMLNRRSGLKGIGGENDMRRLLEHEAAGDMDAKLAIEMFCYQLQKYIAAYYGQCPNLDALVFTGGIGEHSVDIRARTIQPLNHLGLSIDANLNSNQGWTQPSIIHNGSIPILVIPGDEEKAMAEQCMTVL
ncbi:acetate/propionate family kinase [Legionella sp. W05-934-2]|uniref:acetate/propionate family kinase n=1 Tax=Legionella sp. W05-934-2 TaxID=1198649 RepID=UPI0034630F66